MACGSTLASSLHPLPLLRDGPAWAGCHLPTHEQSRSGCKVKSKAIRDSLRARWLVRAPFLACLSDTQLKAKTQLNVISDLKRFQAGQERGHTRTCTSAKWKRVKQSVRCSAKLGRSRGKQTRGQESVLSLLSQSPATKTLSKKPQAPSTTATTKRDFGTAECWP